MASARSIAAICVAICLVSAVQAKDLSVDFEFAPTRCETAICPPDDSYKTLVDQNGALLYHYDHGRDSWFGARVALTLSDGAKITGQRLLSPRVPIVQTTSRDGDLVLLQEAFAVKKVAPGVTGAKYTAERRDGHRYLRGWATPAAGASERLSAIALNGHKPIHYQVRVPAGASAAVALGLCEGWHDKPEQRILDLSVEGDALRTVDTVADLGKNVAGAFWFAARDTNGDGLIDIKVAPSKDTPDKNAILNAFWVFDAKPAETDAALLAGKLDAQAALAFYVGQPDNESRDDVILAKITNQGQTTRTLQPKIVVDTALAIKPLEGGGLRLDHHEVVCCTEKISSVEKTMKDSGQLAVMTLAPMSIEPGKTYSFAVACRGGGLVEQSPFTLQRASEAYQETQNLWTTAGLPFDRIVVPDPTIQAFIDSSIRNIWQAREIKNGLPAFQVGATCYRSLFIVDGAFILEAAALLGAGQDARAGIAYTLTFQHEDGSFEILPRYWKENGIVLWTCVRHAMLTQDKEWLRSVWPKLEKTVGFIKHMRQQTLTNASPLDDGLIPAGFIDGGIGTNDQDEYTNVYWNLLGLKAVIQAARWLDKSDQAAAWQKEYDDFLAAFRKAAQRDMRTDEHGNRYLRILMKDDVKTKAADPDCYQPCKGQWGFCHGVYPGQLFEKSDPLVQGNLAMLAAYEKEGMVTTTGWLTGGIWNYFASFYAHAWLWQGDGRKAAESLYAFANHASPMLVWVEEQGLKQDPGRESGDMPHNWASAEFIRLAVHLLALDRGNQMHLFEGLPKEWTRPGMTTELRKIATPFGPLTCSLRVNADGSAADLKTEPLADPSCEKIIVHLGGWASPDAAAVIALDPRKGGQATIPIKLH